MFEPKYDEDTINYGFFKKAITQKEDNLKKIINEIDKKIQAHTGWTIVSANSEFFNSGQIRYKKIGNMVFVNVIYLALKKNITNENDNYREIATGLPKAIDSPIANISRYSDNKIMRIGVTAAGVLRFHWTGNVSSSDQSFEGSFFYITDE